MSGSRFFKSLAVLSAQILFFAAAANNSAQDLIWREDFEGAFPGTEWDATNDIEFTAVAAYWDKVDLRSFSSFQTPHGGYHAAYCAGVGYENLPTQPQYPNDMYGYMARLVDLTGYDTATLSFWHIMPSTEVPYDRGEIYFGPDRVATISAAITGWQKVSIDLTPWTGVSRFLSFVFVSDGSLNYEGWYVDDIEITGVPSGGGGGPQITDPAWSNGRFTLTAMTEEGPTYYLEASTTLTAGSWTTIQTLPGIGGPVQFRDNNASGPKRFYRIRVQ